MPTIHKKLRMKKADFKKAIEAGDAVAIGYDDGGHFTFHSAVPLETGVTRRVYSGARWDFGGHTTQDGFRVKLTDGSRTYGNAGDLVVVKPSEVLGLVADVQAEQARRLDVQNAKTDALNDAKRMADMLAATVNETLEDENYRAAVVPIYPRKGFGAHVGYSVQIAIYADTPEVTS